MERVLLAQLGAKGDCLYATILARQLRQDFPDAQITWAIFDQNADLLANNPHVDKIWEIPLADRGQTETMWRIFEREALRRCAGGEFDRVIFSQIAPENFQNYDGTVRPSILRAYGRPITVPIESVINLTSDEIDRVEQYVRDQSLEKFRHRILFECTAQSGQSFVNPDLAQAVAAEVYARLPDATVIFTTHLPMKLKDDRSRYAGTLSLREAAHLTHHCTLFVGSGSGGTVAASSTASAPLPMIQLLKKSTYVYASFAHDFEYFDIRDRTVLEMTDEHPARIADCIAAVCRDGIASAFERFDARIPVRFDHYFKSIETYLLSRHRYLDAARSLTATARRYGWTVELIRFGEERVARNLALDPRWLFLSNRHEGERFRASLADARANPVCVARQGRWRDENGR
ncbi:MAG TPA: hypothetical protein PKA57_09880 [Parvibaculum sp.]|uniref:glycosyltransferase family 9 protein n=1 Tax=Parvibaculum sp. TaxID=2024848 RepID=UPI002C3D7650|nr:hypothetical protein [Parvibaculum sp.]HMM14928.1 hypothetical protein [Parvibaculum sp.]